MPTITITETEISLFEKSVCRALYAYMYAYNVHHTSYMHVNVNVKIRFTCKPWPWPLIKLILQLLAAYYPLLTDILLAA